MGCLGLSSDESHGPRERLELLEHAIEEGDAEEAKEFYHLMGKAYGRLRTAYGL